MARLLRRSRGPPRLHRTSLASQWDTCPDGTRLTTKRDPDRTGENGRGLAHKFNSEPTVLDTGDQGAAREVGHTGICRINGDKLLRAARDATRTRPPSARTARFRSPHRDDPAAGGASAWGCGRTEPPPELTERRRGSN